MRVNIIYNAKSTGLHQDAYLLSGMLVVALGKDVKILHVPHFHPQCEEAEINFFIESINPSLFVYASKNILIPNPEWTFQSWKPYLRMFDEIWVKTKEAIDIFANEGIATKYIGWTSVDKMLPPKKDYNQAIVPVGKNSWRHPKPIIQAYMRIQKSNPEMFTSLPVVHIVHNLELPPIPEEVSTKFMVHKGVMPVAEYDKLVQECGLMISTSACEGFCHAVNEGMSAGCTLILSPIDAHSELSDLARFTSQSTSIPHPECLGRLMDVSVPSIIACLSAYLTENNRTKKEKTIKFRQEYETRHEKFLETLDSSIRELVKDMPPYSLQEKLPKESDLPHVSVITITRDRRAFIPLAKYCFIAQSYPPEKLEWIIMDDGDDQIKDLVSDIPNARYFLSDEKMTIGAKRNEAISKASYDVIVMMDDDDVYPNNSILTRVANMLAEPRKECLFSTVIPCYEIHEKKSFMNSPPMKLTMSERVSEATLCFTRDFWNNRKFPDKQIGEAGDFITGRETQCREFSPQDIIVSLIHRKNTSSRKPPAMETNGCHYGFSDELFTLVSEIGERI
jgi:hypothetical protein